jgi:P4 family phage/plasmid primase-like protien
VRWAFEQRGEQEAKEESALGVGLPAAEDQEGENIEHQPGGNGGTGNPPPPPPPPGAGPATPGTPPPQPAAGPTPILPIQFSDNALALKFSQQHADDLLYVPEWNKWLRWEGGRWREDFAVAVFDKARALCAAEGNAARRLLRGRRGTTAATLINRATTIAAIERLARHHTAHTRETSVFDVDRFALNAPDNVLDLRTGLTRAHVRTDYMTRVATVSAALTADCPIWLAFLNRIMAGDQDMIDYLQRVCGYMLTGSVQEHVLFFAHGTGDNGKSTFASVLLGILGTDPHNYAATVPMSTFTVSRYDQHPTDLASLRGVRCAVAHETERGTVWAISKIKLMTGQDRISARFMRQDFFTYDPQFKVFILGNHKPALHTVDQAIRSRFHLIPFAVTVPPDQLDRRLGDKLRAEYPGVLRWMLDGCAAWMRYGLQPPTRVITATEAYLEAENHFETWLTERCETKVQGSAALSGLYASWQHWCEANGVFPCSRNELSEQLQASGLRRENVRQITFLGIRVKTTW